MAMASIATLNYQMVCFLPRFDQNPGEVLDNQVTLWSPSGKKHPLSLPSKVGCKIPILIGKSLGNWENHRYFFGGVTPNPTQAASRSPKPNLQSFCMVLYACAEAWRWTIWGPVWVLGLL